MTCPHQSCGGSESPEVGRNSFTGQDITWQRLLSTYSSPSPQTRPSQSLDQEKWCLSHRPLRRLGNRAEFSDEIASPEDRLLARSPVTVGNQALLDSCSEASGSFVHPDDASGVFSRGAAVSRQDGEWFPVTIGTIVPCCRAAVDTLCRVPLQ